DRLAQEAGLDRESAFVTNAVKHFKFQKRGKRRIHQNPNSAEIEHCRFWLQSEIALVKPKLILAMGGTAAESLTGSRKDILKRRGAVEKTGFGPVLLTVHPSYLLRLPDHMKADANAAFVADLQEARRIIA
ncbi:MAG: uracil-DNA glycosylase family protein, partial [Paracoccaceae bacterium]